MFCFGFAKLRVDFFVCVFSAWSEKVPGGYLSYFGIMSGVDPESPTSAISGAPPASNTA